MARRQNQRDPERDPADEDDEYRPPSRRTANAVIMCLIGAGLLLIAYFILELRMEDLGGTATVIVAAIGFVLLARSRIWR